MGQRLQKLRDGTKQPSSTRLITTLGIAGLVSGIVIVGIYELTFSSISGHKATALRQAVLNVLPSAAAFQPLVYSDGQLQPFEGQNPDAEAVYAGYDAAGGFVGYAIPGEGPGYQDSIQLLYGFDPVTRRITGMEVLQSRETPGSGDKIQKDAGFLSNFQALAVEPKIVAVAQGSKSKPNEIDAITGATVSSNSVVAILNNSNRRWLERLPGADALPPAAPD